ncbi:MAG: T9SS type A sorting domain-containing protein, partial [bacterium]|nr:T9SS type A sorting domain-containing protein [bacterium]
GNGTGTEYDGSYNSVIIFYGLTEEAELEIFNINGALLFSKKLPEGNWYQWDVKDKNGKSIPSGVYIYQITDTKENKKRGKFSIIR